MSQLGIDWDLPNPYPEASVNTKGMVVLVVWYSYHYKLAKYLDGHSSKEIV